MNTIFHNKTAEDGYTRFWMILGPLLFVLPVVGSIAFGFWLLSRDLNRIANKIQ